MNIEKAFLLLAICIMACGVSAQKDTIRRKHNGVHNPTFAPVPPSHSHTQKDSTMLHTKKRVIFPDTAKK